MVPAYQPIPIHELHFAFLFSFQAIEGRVLLRIRQERRNATYAMVRSEVACVLPVAPQLCATPLKPLDRAQSFANYDSHEAQLSCHINCASLHNPELNFGRRLKF
jgi:hypothetical protein